MDDRKREVLMKAALWTKLKCAGPLLDFDSELQRFLSWLPPAFYPLLTKFREQQLCHRQAASSAERIEIEQQALRNLRGYLINIPERQLLNEFYNRIDTAHGNSVEARQAALSGEVIDSDMDIRQIDALCHWLEDFRHSKHREIACWLLRLLQAWRLERGC